MVEILESGGCDCDRACGNWASRLGLHAWPSTSGRQVGGSQEMGAEYWYLSAEICLLGLEDYLSGFWQILKPPFQNSDMSWQTVITQTLWVLASLGQR